MVCVNTYRHHLFVHSISFHSFYKGFQFLNVLITLLSQCNSGGGSQIKCDQNYFPLWNMVDDFGEQTGVSVSPEALAFQRGLLDWKSGLVLVGTTLWEMKIWD